MTKDFKMSMVKYLIRVHYDAIDKGICYFYDMYLKILTIIIGHIGEFYTNTP